MPPHLSMLFYRDRETKHHERPTSFSEASVQRNSEWVTFVEHLPVVLDVRGQALALILSQLLGYIHSLIMIGSTELNHPDKEIRMVGLQSARAQRRLALTERGSWALSYDPSRKLSGE